MLNYQEIYKDIFQINPSNYFAHCISADFALGAGIAKEFERRYELKKYLAFYPRGIYPNCIQVGHVFNLVTKNHYHDKPTLSNLQESLIFMKKMISGMKISSIYMPKIGSGLDKLKWGSVKSLILDVFQYENISITICKL